MQGVGDTRPFAEIDAVRSGWSGGPCSGGPCRARVSKCPHGRLQMPQWSRSVHHGKPSIPPPFWCGLTTRGDLWAAPTLIEELSGLISYLPY